MNTLPVDIIAEFCSNLETNYKRYLTREIEFEEYSNLDDELVDQYAYELSQGYRKEMSDMKVYLLKLASNQAISRVLEDESQDPFIKEQTALAQEVL